MGHLPTRVQIVMYTGLEVKERHSFQSSASYAYREVHEPLVVQQASFPAPRAETR
jgi:hypothetical protein